MPNSNFRGSFWWRDLLKLLDSYKGMATVLFRNGTSCFFWLDLWNRQALCLHFLALLLIIEFKSIPDNGAKMLVGIY